MATPSDSDDAWEFEKDDFAATRSVAPRLARVKAKSAHTQQIDSSSDEEGDDEEYASPAERKKQQKRSTKKPAAAASRTKKQKEGVQKKAKQAAPPRASVSRWSVKKANAAFWYRFSL